MVPGDLAGCGVGIVAVQIVQINIIGVYPAQAAAQLDADGLGRGVFVDGGIADLHAELRRDDEVRPPSGDGLADNFLGHAACRACEAVVALVHIGRVDEIDAKLRRVMHQPDRVRLGDGAAEGHGAEAQTGDGNAGSR